MFNTRELHIAVKHDWRPYVLRLLKSGTNVDQTDNYGFTPLFHVKSARMARILLERGANVNYQPEDLGTALVHHVRNIPALNRPTDSLSIVSVLLEYNADINACDRSGNTALHFVSTVGMATLLINKGALVDARNSLLQTPFMTAIDNVGQQLYDEMHCRAIVYDSRVDWLHWGPKLKLLRVLLENGANVNTLDRRNDTILNYFLCSGPLYGTTYLKENVLTLLLDHGFNLINHKNFEGRTALNYAIMYHGERFVTRLLEEGANIYTVDSYGCTPLVRT